MYMVLCIAQVNMIYILFKGCTVLNQDRELCQYLEYPGCPTRLQLSDGHDSTPWLDEAQHSQGGWRHIWGEAVLEQVHLYPKQTV